MRMKVLAVVLGLSLSAGAAACPTDQFQRQGGNFKWMVSGEFNGRTFGREGVGAQSLRQLMREFRGKVRAKRGDGERGKRARVNFIGGERRGAKGTKRPAKKMLVPRRPSAPT